MMLCEVTPGEQVWYQGDQCGMRRVGHGLDWVVVVKERRNEGL